MTDLSQVLVRAARDGSVAAELENCLVTQKEFVGRLLECLMEHSGNAEISTACFVLINRWFTLHTNEAEMMKEIRPAVFGTLPFAQRRDLVEHVVQLFSRYIPTMTDEEVAQLVGKFKEDEGYFVFSLQFSLSLHRGKRGVPFDIDRELIWRAIRASEWNIIRVGLDLLTRVGCEVGETDTAGREAILEMEGFLFTSPEFRPNLMNGKVWQVLSGVISVDIPNNAHICTVMELISQNPPTELLGGLIMFLIYYIGDVPEDRLKDICTLIVRYELAVIQEGNPEPWVFQIVRNVYWCFDRTKAFSFFVSLIEELMGQSNAEMLWIAGMFMQELFEADSYQSATYFREKFQGIFSAFLQSGNKELAFVALDLMSAAVKHGEQVIQGWQSLVEKTYECLQAGDPIVAGKVYCFLDLYIQVTLNVLAIFKMLCSCIPSSGDLVIFHVAMLMKSLDGCIYFPTDAELSDLLTVAQCLQNAPDDSLRLMGCALKVRLWCYSGSVEVPDEVGLMFNALIHGREIGSTELVCVSFCLCLLLAQHKGCVNGSSAIEDLMWTFLESILQNRKRRSSSGYIVLAFECILRLLRKCYKDEQKRNRIFDTYRRLIQPTGRIIELPDNLEVRQILLMLTRKFVRFLPSRNAYVLWFDIGKCLQMDDMDSYTFILYMKILSGILARQDVEKEPKERAIQIVRDVLTGNKFREWDIGEQRSVAMYLGGKLCTRDENITKEILQVTLDSMGQIPEAVAAHACPFFAKFMTSSPFRTEDHIRNIFGCVMGILQSQSPHPYWWDIIAMLVQCAQSDKEFWRPALASHAEFFMNLYRGLMQGHSLKTAIGPILATLLLQICLQAPDQFREEDILAFLTTRYESTITFPKAHLSVLLEFARRDCSEQVRCVLCRESYWLIANPNLTALVPPVSQSQRTREYAQARIGLLGRVMELDPEQQILAQATEGQTQIRQRILTMCRRFVELTSK